MMEACDGSVSGTAVRALVNRTFAAASASSAGATPTPRRSARKVSMVTSRMFGCAEGFACAQPPVMAKGGRLMARAHAAALRQMPSAISPEP